MPRTRKTPDIATEFAHACAGGPVRMHDADLCERVRELEREVERLRADRHHCHHPYYVQPYWTWNSTGSSTTVTYPNWSAGNTVTMNG